MPHLKLDRDRRQIITNKTITRHFHSYEAATVGTLAPGQLAGLYMLSNTPLNVMLILQAHLLQLLCHAGFILPAHCLCYVDLEHLILTLLSAALVVGNKATLRRLPSPLLFKLIIQPPAKRCGTEMEIANHRHIVIAEHRAYYKVPSRKKENLQNFSPLSSMQCTCNALQ